MTQALTKEIRLLKHQYQLISDYDTEILGMVAGLGSGKTYSIVRKAVALMFANAGHDGIITEPNYPLLTQILIPELKLALEECCIPYKFKAAESIFYCYFAGVETRIICKSMENYDRLIGINAAWVIMDEFDTAKQKTAYMAYLKLMGRIRVGNKRQMVIVSTPEGFKAFYRIFVTEADKGNKRLIHAKTRDNKHLPPDYIDRLIGTYPIELQEAYLNGKFLNLTSGTVYRSFDRKDNGSTETIEDGEPLFIGQDFNVGNMASCVFVKRSSGYHCVDELKDILDTPSMLKVVEDRYKGHPIAFYPDASGKSRKTNNASKSDIDLIRQAGHQVRAKASNPPVKDRILSTNTAFTKQLVWVNTDKCPETTKCLEQQAYDKNGEPDKKSGVDHQNDAFSYFCFYELPVVKPIIRVGAIG